MGRYKAILVTDYSSLIQLAVIHSSREFRRLENMFRLGTLGSSRPKFKNFGFFELLLSPSKKGKAWLQQLHECVVFAG